MLDNILDALFERWPAIPYVLFGVFYVWLDLMTFSSLVFTDATETAMRLHTLFQWVFFCGSAICNLACIFFWRPLTRLLMRPRASLAAVGCLSLCTLLCVLGLGGTGSVALIVIAALVGVAGQTAVQIFLAMRFMAQSGTQVFIYIALFRILAAVMYFMVAGLPRGLAIGVMLALPLVLGVSSVHSFKREPFAPRLATDADESLPGAPELPTSRAALARFLVAGFALVFVINAAGFGGPLYWPYVQALCVVFALVLIVLLVYRSSHQKEALSYWFYIAFTAVLLAFAVAAILPVSTPFNYLVCGSFRSVFDSFYMGFLVLTLRHSARSVVRTTGLFYGCYLSATVLGMGLHRFVQTSASLTVYSVAATAFAMAVLVYLLIVFTPKDLQPLLGITLEQPASKRQPAVDANLSGLSAQTVHSMAQRFRLSQREEEVMGMLLQGYTVNMICSAMVVSASTVKTHMHHIYAKADVKSREELLLLAQGWQSE